MIINKAIIKKLERTYRIPFTDELKQYLLVKYAEEPFPYEYSEQDLYNNISNDIRDYEAGKLNITVKSAYERLLEDRDYLKNLYIEKYSEMHDLEEYIDELEHILSEHGLESVKMAKRRVEYSTNQLF